MPLWDELTDKQRNGWRASAGVIWDLATTGRATLTRPEE